MPPWSLRNFGDELAPMILQSVRPGLPVRHTDFPSADSSIVGSVLQRAILEGQSHTFILGTGLDPNLQAGQIGHLARLARRSHIAGVRGPITARLLGLPPSAVSGDSALALCGSPELLKPARATRGLILAHFSVGLSPLAMTRLQVEATRLGADVEFTWTRPETLLSRLAEAAWVASSSLHGVIVADMAGTPAIPITLGSQSVEDLRFADYAQSVGRNASKRVPLAELRADDVLSIPTGPDPKRLMELGTRIREELEVWLSARGF